MTPNSQTYRVLCTHIHVITIIKETRPHRFTTICFHCYTCPRGNFKVQRTVPNALPQTNLPKS